MTINVTATNAGANPVTLNNTIPVGNFGGVGFSSGTGSLVVNAVTSVGGSKSFAPTPILQGGVSTLTITLTNSAAVAATITSFTDALTTLGANPQFTVAAAPRGDDDVRRRPQCRARREHDHAGRRQFDPRRRQLHDHRSGAGLRDRVDRRADELDRAGRAGQRARGARRRRSPAC